MSFSLSSLVSSIKDKSTQAMATLGSDLKEFSTIMQEDVAEVAKTVRTTVHEKSETMKQRVEQRRQEEGQEGSDEEHDDVDGVDEEEEKQEEPAEKPVAETSIENPDAEDKQEEALEELTAETKEKPKAKDSARQSSGSFFSFAALSLEEVGSKILQSADEILGTITGGKEGEEGALDDEVAMAREYRLLALQEDSATYLEVPSDEEAFARWKESVSDDELKEIEEDVLANYPVVAAKLQELVSETLTEDEFWARYIFKASQLAAQTQRGADLLEHALNDEDEEIGWDVDSPRHEDEEDKKDTSPARPATAGSASESESWIELDERREGGSDTKGNPLPETLKEQEEDVDWGDDDEQDETSAPDNSATSATEATATNGDKKKGDDWGEWD